MSYTVNDTGPTNHTHGALDYLANKADEQTASLSSIAAMFGSATPLVVDVVVTDAVNAGVASNGVLVSSDSKPYRMAVVVAVKPSGAAHTLPGGNTGLIHIGFNTADAQNAIVSLSQGVLYRLPPNGNLNKVRIFASTAADGCKVYYLP